MTSTRGPERLDGVELLILESLADGAKHGYLLTTDIAARHGRRLGPGTLYAALTRLETRGMIEGTATDDRRRPYELTDQGAGALRDRLQEMARFSASGLARLDAIRS